jgi:hypothetical protein
MTVFDEATAVTRLGEGRYLAHPDQRFALVAPGGATPPAVNGGVLIATVLRAVLDCSVLPHPVATSAHFLRVARLAPARIDVTWLKTGRTAATARATLIQDDQPVLEATVTTGTVPVSRSATSDANGAGDGDQADSGRLRWTDAAPVLPSPQECVDLGPWPGTVAPDGTAGYASQVRLLLDPAVTGWRFGEPAGMPVMRGYFALREDREPDALMLALAVDGLPPVVFGLGATGWAPTVELTMHMRLVPAPGLLTVAARSRHVSGGWFDEEAEVWDSAGNLVAQSRQLARVGRGPVRRVAPSDHGTALIFQTKTAPASATTAVAPNSAG